MIIVADSGSTKTEWRLCSEKEVLGSIQTIGLNPLALDEASTISELKKSKLSTWNNKDVLSLYFYSAGIIDDKLQEKVSKTLQSLFKESKIVVNSDLLGAARAVFGTSEGIVGILGTGSNTGFYDGQKIANQVPSLGYLLGDEGSGSVLGRSIIKNFLRNELSDELNKSFKSFYPEYSSLVETIYSKPHAARFLASFVPFIYKHKEDRFIKDLILSDLNKFIRILRNYHGSHKIGIIGSVGFQFQAEIELLARNAELSIINYVKNPIDNLTTFHQSTIQ